MIGKGQFIKMNTPSISPIVCMCCGQKEFEYEHYCGLLNGKIVTCSMCGVQHAKHRPLSPTIMVGVSHNIPYKNEK